MGAGAVLQEGARLGARVRIGSHAVVHAGTEIGADCVVEDGVVLGKRPRLRPAPQHGRGPGALVIGAGATICCGAVVYAGASVGAGAIIGDQSQVRERATIGERTVVGRGSAVEYGAQVGRGCSIQTGVYVTALRIVEDDVFLGPGVVTTNDDTMGRHDRRRAPRAARACAAPAGSAAAPSSCPAWRWGRRRSWPRAPWSRPMSPPCRW